MSKELYKEFLEIRINKLSANSKNQKSQGVLKALKREYHNLQII